jgi:hypothetical protein
MITNIQTKKVHSTFHARLIFAVVIGLAMLAGCQPMAAAPVLPSATLFPPTATQVSGIPTSTRTPFSTSQPATHTPAIVPTAIDAPIVLVGTLIDGTGAAPLEDAVILIEHGYITAVGSRQEVEIPADAQVIDLQDATLLPGFINAHVHSTYSPTLLQKWLQAGVTTVRDLGARYPFFRFSTRDELNQDPGLAALISTGPIITVPGGYPIAINNFPSLAVTNPEHARREVTRLISAGADVIKIAVDSGEGLPTLSLA